MIANMAPAGAQPRNALIAPLRQEIAATQSQRGTPSNLPALLANTIGHAALLADTPGKWASTIAMLRQNGVDPEGYVDFEKGRSAAMAAAGITPPEAN
jgi:hypothetical protein